jgi:hypothetical protein
MEVFLGWDRILIHMGDLLDGRETSKVAENAFKSFGDFHRTEISRQ